MAEGDFGVAVNKKHKIFIAINLPWDVKKVLSGYQKKWTELPVKWTLPENMHITLVFLGDLTDIELGGICIATKEAVKRHVSFEINLNKICYGPINSIPPRMVWADGQKSKEAFELKRNLENLLLEKVNFTPENRPFSPHVTLARIGVFAWRAIEPEERPEVNENIDLNFTVGSIEIMESELKRGTPKYVIIESCQFQ